MSSTVNPEVAALRDRLEAHGRELSEIRGSLQQMDKFVAVTAHQSIWQLVALIVTLCAAIAGGLAYQTSMIDKRIDQIEKRFEQSDKNFNSRFEQIDSRFEQSEKNFNARFEQIEQQIQQLEKHMTARFEDLKQEVRARR